MYQLNKKVHSNSTLIYPFIITGQRLEQETQKIYLKFRRMDRTNSYELPAQTIYNNDDLLVNFALSDIRKIFSCMTEERIMLECNE